MAADSIVAIDAVQSATNVVLVIVRNGALAKPSPERPIDLGSRGIYKLDMAKAEGAVTKLFQSNRSQAVRLPKAVEFPAEVREVAIRRVGRTRVIAPANAVWDDFFEAPGIDLGVRDQPETKEREAF